MSFRYTIETENPIVTDGNKMFNCKDGKLRLKIVEANPWHTGTPTEVEDDIYWKWNYALVLNTAYDCIGNYLAGLLFMPNFEKNVFSAPLGNGKELEVPFDDVIAWQKITPFEEEE